ncbi:MAG: hypothetical protein M3018_13840 [Actinomycetota bacterium]|nr:hypothetical protein [Actinomycetota bacterium]
MSQWPELRDSMVTAARRQHELRVRDERPARVRRTARVLPLPKLSSVAVLLAALTAIGVAVVGLTVVRHAPQPAVAGGGHGRGAVSERAARRVAAQALSQLVLPAGAVRSGLVPGTPGDLRVPADLIATPNRVHVFKVWRLPESPARVISFIQAHRPAGSRLSGRTESGSGPNSSTVVIDQASFVLSFPARGHPAIFREIAIDVERVPGGGSAVRADGEAGWLYPRTAENQIPATADRVRVVKLKRGYRQPRQALSVTSTDQIERLIGVLNALPALPPDAIPVSRQAARLCTGMRLDFSFYSAGRVKPVARAVYVPSCGFVYLGIAGRWQLSHQTELENSIYLRAASPIRELMSLAAKLP